jgi:hypothetical protein
MYIIYVYCGKSSPKMWDTFTYNKNYIPHKNCPICRWKVAQSGHPGTDVMITILCDFWKFSEQNWRFSQKPMLWSTKNSFVFSQKRPFFRRLFRRKYLKYHNIGPWLPAQLWAAFLTSVFSTVGKLRFLPLASVTRLGEFSPKWWLITSDSFLRIAGVAYIFGRIISTKNVLGFILGDIFHKLIWSPCPWPWL